MKKKILSICLVAVIAAMAIAGASLAYFTAEDTATNVFTVGNVAIDLTEPEWDKKGAVDAPEVYPGEALAKDPTVKNTLCGSGLVDMLLVRSCQKERRLI